MDSQEMNCMRTDLLSAKNLQGLGPLRVYHYPTRATSTQSAQIIHRLHSVFLTEPIYFHILIIERGIQREAVNLVSV